MICGSDKTRCVSVCVPDVEKEFSEHFAWLVSFDMTGKSMRCTLFVVSIDVAGDLRCFWFAFIVVVVPLSSYVSIVGKIDIFDSLFVPFVCWSKSECSSIDPVHFSSPCEPTRIDLVSVSISVLS